MITGYSIPALQELDNPYYQAYDPYAGHDELAFGDEDEFFKKIARSVGSTVKKTVSSVARNPLSAPLAIPKMGFSLAKKAIPNTGIGSTIRRTATSVMRNPLLAPTALPRIGISALSKTATSLVRPPRPTSFSSRYSRSGVRTSLERMRDAALARAAARVPYRPPSASAIKYPRAPYAPPRPPAPPRVPMVVRPPVPQPQALPTVAAKAVPVQKPSVPVIPTSTASSTVTTTTTTDTNAAASPVATPKTDTPESGGINNTYLIAGGVAVAAVVAIIALK